MPPLEPQQLADVFQKTDPRELREDCPTAARIWEAVAGELSPEDVQPLVDHTARCVDCSIAWRVALEVHRDAGVEAPAAAVLPFRFSRARTALTASGFGLLAAGIAAAVFFQGPWTHPKGSLEAERSSERGAKRPLDSVTASGVQPKGAVVLRWSPYPGAERYSVTVMSGSLDVLYRAFGVSGTELRLPAETLAAQPSPARVLWSVQAILPGGRAVDSDVFTVDVK
ncbi:MAG: hypothetical protein ACLPJH_02915 [Myxococcaceae bacterium]